MEITNTTAYAIYIPIVIGLTILVARKLYRNSGVLMLDIFEGNTELSLATNKLFEIGFYLLNIGIALFTIKMNYVTNDNIMEKLSAKTGAFAIFLGVMLFLNVLLIFRARRKTKTSFNKKPQKHPFNA
jgi:hypothetical protein